MCPPGVAAAAPREAKVNNRNMIYYKIKACTVCPRSSDPFYLVTYYIKLFFDTVSRTATMKSTRNLASFIST